MGHIDDHSVTPHWYVLFILLFLSVREVADTENVLMQ